MQRIHGLSPSELSKGDICKCLHGLAQSWNVADTCLCAKCSLPVSHNRWVMLDFLSPCQCDTYHNVWAVCSTRNQQSHATERATIRMVYPMWKKKIETIPLISEYLLNPCKVSDRILSTLHHKPWSKCKDKITSVILVWVKAGPLTTVVRRPLFWAGWQRWPLLGWKAIIASVLWQCVITHYIYMKRKKPGVVGHDVKLRGVRMLWCMSNHTTRDYWRL